MQDYSFCLSFIDLGAFFEYPTLKVRWSDAARGILGISWKDRITNEKVRVRTGQHSMDDILSERRLRWLGHVIRMDHQRILVPGVSR